jgi:hypothetical protein
MTVVELEIVDTLTFKGSSFLWEPEKGKSRKIISDELKELLIHLPSSEAERMIDCIPVGLKKYWTGFAVGSGPKTYSV